MSDKYFHRNNFQAYTGKEPLKTNAIELCGKNFCDELIKQGIYVRTEEFWKIINNNLDIPDDAYAKQQAEKERAELAEKARLLQNKKEIFSKERHGWIITVFELPDSEIFGKQFIAEYSKEDELTKTTGIYHGNKKNPKETYNDACNLIDQQERYEKRDKAFQEHYLVLKPLYLMILYLSGGDNYDPYLENRNEKKCKENFIGLNGWNGLDFDIVNKLEDEGLIELSSTKKRLSLTKQAMKEAREILKVINLEGVDRLLEQREHHEEYLNYKNRLEMMRELRLENEYEDTDFDF